MNPKLRLLEDTEKHRGEFYFFARAKMTKIHLHISVFSMYSAKNWRSLRFMLLALLFLAFLGIPCAVQSEEPISPSIKTNFMDNTELLISQDEIKQKIAEVARILDEEYQGEELTMVLVMKGALCIGADLIRELKTPCAVEYVSASSYGQRGTKRGELKILGMEDLDLTAKNVLLVDDIFDSGETISKIFVGLDKKKPKTLKSLVLLAKNVGRDVAYVPDYVLFNIENQFVIGFGLDYKELYRGLPGIYIFK
jgi:hypoxanthine phosphoribosyltransferase